LGGTDMDKILLEHIAGQFKRETGIDLLNDKMAVQRLREAAEKAKVELSSTVSTDINLPFITADASGPKHLTMTITRAKLEDLVSPIIDRCRHPMEQALNDAKLSPKDIDRIIMVGGPTRMPVVQKFVEDYVGKKIERGVDPMECVALGAAVQAAVLTGEVKDILLLDVTPLSLGIETLGGVFTKLIERNTTIPVKKSQVFSTASDNQPSVEVHVLQGERPMARDNVSLGKFYLDGIPSAPRGMPQIEVTFDIDANGILHVTAKDLGTSKEQSIRISAPHKLSKDEVEKYIKQAEQFAEEDTKRREEIEAKNELDNLVYATEKSLKEYGDKMSGDERLALDRALNEAKDALKGGEIARIRKAKEELTTASHKLAEQVYRAATQKQRAGAEGGAGGQQGTPTGKSSDDGGQSGDGKKIVDAEVVDESPPSS
ncbi:MAG: Hsp70 family protein, partial [Elusimicrobia bacterium]|nr:Hsp70 family protein [Elusimicrobiota bacterium]